MPAAELDDWMLLEVVDPWGQTREDIQFANLAAHVAMIAGVKKWDNSQFTPRDFLLRFKIDADLIEDETIQDQKKAERLMLLWAQASNARWAEQHPDIPTDIPEEPPTDGT
jgi:hypothetical protein